jgi:hypothetical protein
VVESQVFLAGSRHPLLYATWIVSKVTGNRYITRYQMAKEKNNKFHQKLVTARKKTHFLRFLGRQITVYKPFGGTSSLKKKRTTIFDRLKFALVWGGLRNSRTFLTRQCILSQFSQKREQAYEKEHTARYVQ